MYSLYHAYQAYERRAGRGELDEQAPLRRLPWAERSSFAYRLGDMLVRTGLKLKHQPLAGQALTSSSMATN
jgi:hypothetical protein